MELVYVFLYWNVNMYIFFLSVVSQLFLVLIVGKILVKLTWVCNSLSFQRVIGISLDFPFCIQLITVENGCFSYFIFLSKQINQYSLGVDVFLCTYFSHFGCIFVIPVWLGIYLLHSISSELSMSYLNFGFLKFF